MSNEQDGHPFDTQILLLRIGIVALALIIVAGVVYYSIHYIRLAVDRFSTSPEQTVSNPYAKYQLIVRVRIGESRDPAADTPIAIEEYGQPIGRNLIATTVTTNATGTAVVELPTGQYTVRPADAKAWSGLTTVNLTTSREISLLIDPTVQ